MNGLKLVAAGDEPGGDARDGDAGVWKKFEPPVDCATWEGAAGTAGAGAESRPNRSSAADRGAGAGAGTEAGAGGCAGPAAGATNPEPRRRILGGIRAGGKT